MYNGQFLELGGEKIEQQILAMPESFNSMDFYSQFEQNYPKLYDQFILMYMSKGHDRPHAVQIVHTQLMHTVNDRYHHLARKVRTIPNPKGGQMSEWSRV